MVRKLRMHELGRLSPEDFRAAGKRPLIVVLDNVRSMHNVGSLFRTADAFRVSGIYLCGMTPVPPHQEIEKTALGATESVEWRHFASTSDAVTELANSGYRIFAVEQTTSAIPLRNFRPEAPLALVFGHEVKGVSEEVLAHCHGAVVIPQDGTKHSLNVSVSAGIVLWEMAGHFPL